MKKKIKDLTLIEAKKYCANKRFNCKKCKLLIDNVCLFFISSRRVLKDYKRQLNREVDIDE